MQFLDKKFQKKKKNTQIEVNVSQEEFNKDNSNLTFTKFRSYSYLVTKNRLQKR